MRPVPRWQRCITHQDADARKFVDDYFGVGDGKCLLVAGAGFDPRNLVIAEILAERLNGRLSAVFLRERRRRAGPQGNLRNRADSNANKLTSLVTNNRLVEVDILAAEDNAVVGGRRAVAALEQEDLAVFTDVVLDASALSVGIMFPLAKFLLEKCVAIGVESNFHIMVASLPRLDAEIKGVPNDAVDPVHGFSGRIDLEECEHDAKIWIPLVTPKRHSALRLIREKLRGPVEVCPVLPLSPDNPRSGDKLIAEYETELYQEWEVTPGNLIYAVEDYPLDLYRTISAIHRRYTGVFHNVIGSHIVLTPSGSKALSIGALMAAIEYDLPVRYVEAVAYDVEWDSIGTVNIGTSQLVHVWLHGRPYPMPTESQIAV
jgi:hypothetical protein